jgi:hypothetical protein
MYAPINVQAIPGAPPKPLPLKDPLPVGDIVPVPSPGTVTWMAVPVTVNNTAPDTGSSPKPSSIKPSKAPVNKPCDRLATLGSEIVTVAVFCVPSVAPPVGMLRVSMIVSLGDSVTKSLTIGIVKV